MITLSCWFALLVVFVYWFFIACFGVYLLVIVAVIARRAICRHFVSRFIFVAKYAPYNQPRLSPTGLRGDKTLNIQDHTPHCGK